MSDKATMKQRSLDLLAEAIDSEKPFVLLVIDEDGEKFSLKSNIEDEEDVANVLSGVVAHLDGEPEEDGEDAPRTVN